MIHKILFITVSILSLVLSQAVYADSLSYSTQTSTGYRSDTYGYDHSFSDVYGLSLGYSADMIASSYYSLSSSLNMNLNEGQKLSFSGSSYVSNSQYSATTLGMQYSVSAVSGSDESDAESNEPSPIFLPNYNIGMDLCNNRYEKIKLSNTSGDLTIGLGTSIYDNWNVSASLDEYFYNNESKIKDQASAVLMPGSKKFRATSSSPKSIVSGTVSYKISDYFSVYYGTNTIDDLIGELTSSVTTGITGSLILLDVLSLDANTETSSGVVYNSASISYSY